MPYEYHLDEAIIERARKEINENPEIIDSLIVDLRQRLQDTPGYHGRLDDAFLVRFIRYRKFNLEHAQERIMRYYGVRNEQDDIFSDFFPSAIQHMLASGVVSVLPNRDRESRRVVLYRPGSWEYKKYPMVDFIRTISIVNEYLMREEETQVCGIALIIDLSGVSLAMMGQFTPSYFKKMRNIHLHASPLRLRTVLVIHGPNVFNYVYKIIETLSPKKLLGKIKNCRSDLSKLHAELCHLDGRSPGLEILPSEERYGGTGSFSCHDFYRELLDSEDTFVEEKQFFIEPPRSKSRNSFFQKHFK